jgi:hypothetical protein
MRLAECLLLATGVCVIESACQSPLDQSHIDANVPDTKSFDTLMKRDLRAYFEKTLSTTGKVHVEYQLLRDGPTQTGISYPKFYVWATVFRGARNLTEGAVRVAAVDRTQFTVTDFLSEDQIVAEPEKIKSIFPPALNEKILALATAK